MICQCCQSALLAWHAEQCINCSMTTFIALLQHCVVLVHVARDRGMSQAAVTCPRPCAPCRCNKMQTMHTLLHFQVATLSGKPPIHTHPPTRPGATPLHPCSAPPQRRAAHDGHLGEITVVPPPAEPQTHLPTHPFSLKNLRTLRACCARWRPVRSRSLPFAWAACQRSQRAR